MARDVHQEAVFPQEIHPEDREADVVDEEITGRSIEVQGVLTRFKGVDGQPVGATEVSAGRCRVLTVVRGAVCKKRNFLAGVNQVGGCRVVILHGENSGFDPQHGYQWWGGGSGFSGCQEHDGQQR